jgi:hypothetical protein
LFKSAFKIKRLFANHETVFVETTANSILQVFGVGKVSLWSFITSQFAGILIEKSLFSKRVKEESVLLSSQQEAKKNNIVRGISIFLNIKARLIIKNQNFLVKLEIYLH